jgi:hypothetical protein
VTLQVIVFSKDRPLQLHGYLTSLRKHLQGDYEVIVLARIEEPYEYAYREVAGYFPTFTIVDQHEFAAGVLMALGVADYTLFGVDDAVYVDAVSVQRLLTSFTALPELFGVSLRLGQNVTQNMFVGQVTPPSLKTRLGTWTWDPFGLDARGDWSYIFDLCGTVYRTEDVRALVEALPHVQTPNQFEASAQPLWRGEAGERLMACFPTSRLVVPTVNVVQRDFPNGIVGERELTPAFLLDLWQHGLRMDVERFAEQEYRSIHVADFFLRRGT